MKPPQAFRDFMMQPHQDLNLIYPDWGFDSHTARHDIYESFRRRYGDGAMRELSNFVDRLLSDAHADLEEFWFKESEADWVISSEGVRRLFEDFQAWAYSVRYSVNGKSPPSGVTHPEAQAQGRSFVTSDKEENGWSNGRIVMLFQCRPRRQLVNLTCWGGSFSSAPYGLPRNSPKISDFE